MNPTFQDYALGKLTPTPTKKTASTTPAKDEYGLSNLKKAIDFAKKNPSHPDSKELRRRIETGQLNFELRSLGLPETPIKQPKVDFSQIQQPEAPMSKLPEQGRIAETGQDVGQMFQGLGESVGKMVEGVKQVATDSDFSVGQKAMGISGEVAGGISSVIGDVVLGGAKLFTSQETEDKLKSIVQEAGQGVAQTETAQKIASWYDGLDKNEKLVVDSAGGIGALMADVFTGGVAAKGAKTVGEITVAGAKEAGQSVIPQITRAGEATVDTVTDIFKPSQAKLEKTVVDTFQKGVKPNLQGQQTLGQADKYKGDVVEAVKVIDTNKNNLKFTNDVGEVTTGRTPESLQEFSESIEQTKKQIYDAYDTLAVQAGDNGLKVDGVKMANELDAVINNKALQLSNPDAVRYAQEVRDRFVKAGEIDAKTAQEIIQNYNNSLKAFYRNPTPEGLTKNAVDALMANQMRQALDEGIEGLTGAQYQSLKNQYAALKTIERDVLRATLRDARKNVKGLIDYTDIFSGGQLVTGLLTLNPGAIAQGVAQKGIAEWFKFLNDPNRAVRNMFESAGKLEKDKTMTPIPTRKQLEAPTEGSSNVSIYTPMELGARSDSTIDAANFSNTKPPEQSPKLPVRPLLNAPGKNPINMPEKPRGTVEQRERANPNIKKPEATEAKPSVIEQSIGHRQVAAEELKASMMGAESGIKQTSEGYARFTSFPDWIPSELRRKELFERVWSHVENSTFPKEASVREAELYALLKSRVEKRAFELDSIANNNLNETGKPMTWDDIPFGFVLAGGLGAYYYFNPDGDLLPLAVVGSMNPQTRKFAIKQLNESYDEILKRRNTLIRNGIKDNNATIKQLDKGLQSIEKERVKLNASFNSGEIPTTKGAQVTDTSAGFDATTQQSNHVGKANEMVRDFQLNGLDPKSYKTPEDFINAYGSSRNAPVKQGIKPEVLGNHENYRSTTVSGILQGQALEKYKKIGDVKVQIDEFEIPMPDGSVKTPRGIFIVDDEGARIIVRPPTSLGKDQFKKTLYEELDHAATMRANPDFMMKGKYTVGDRKAYSESAPEISAKSNSERRLAEERFSANELTDIWKKANTSAGFDSLATEAKKYKSAEEFVKAQGMPVYRGTLGKNLEDTSNGLKILPNATFTTTARQTARAYAGDTGTVHDLIISPEAKFFKTDPYEIDRWLKKKERELFPLVQEEQMFADAKKGVIKLDDITKKNIDVQQRASEEYGRWLTANGYDGYSMQRENGVEYAVINKDVIKTKSQLTDIWKKANGHK